LSPISAALLAQKLIIALERRANTKGMGFRMTSIAAELAKKTGQKTTARKNPGEMLDQRYRQIGIQAVAAAARYHGMAKNPAYAPVSAQWYKDSDVA
jgi:hypothetical protein